MQNLAEFNKPYKAGDDVRLNTQCLGDESPAAGEVDDRWRVVEVREYRSGNYYIVRDMTRSAPDAEVMDIDVMPYHLDPKENRYTLYAWPHDEHGYIYRDDDPRDRQMLLGRFRTLREALDARKTYAAGLLRAVDKVFANIGMIELFVVDFLAPRGGQMN